MFIIDLALERVSAIGFVIAGLIVLESLESVPELVDVDVSTVSNISDASLRRPAAFYKFLFIHSVTKNLHVKNWKIVSRVPKIWPAVPIFLARVNRVWKYFYRFH